ncbi:DAO-domain-containing protein [Hypoxylon sp. NC0597]|nr:DAO-domain-containing protein [Hypoxylon sp. NC0597]
MGFIKSRVENFKLVSKALRDLQEQAKALAKHLINIKQNTPTNRAEIVIIGSGITAAAVARSVLLESSRLGIWRRVVVLESRTLCSGATGRSGGQIQGSPHEQFDDLRKSVGYARAASILRFQISQIQELQKLCAAEKWDIAEFREVETVDFYLTDEERDAAFEKVKTVRRYVPELVFRMWCAEDARRYFGANKNVKGAVSYLAATMSPYRFVSCVWKSLLSQYSFFLYMKTNTTVISVQTPVSKDHGYEVITTHETFKCDHVVHATDAFASELIPGLRGKLTGMLGTMVALRPSARFPSVNGRRSWVISHQHGHDTATERPTSGRRSGDDDSRLDPLPLAHLHGILPTLFAFSRAQELDGWRNRRTWSGIMGVTGDLLPFVGRLDASLTGRSPGFYYDTPHTVEPGEWISAGYCGKGMAWAWLCGTAVGIRIAGTENEDAPPYPGRPAGPLRQWLPRGLEPTLERLEKADLGNLVHRFF